jgi:hypothetical protein
MKNLLILILLFSIIEAWMVPDFPKVYTLASASENREIKISDIFKLQGFSLLQTTSEILSTREVRKYLFIPDGSIIALDNNSDGQNIWRFDQTGKFLNKIGFQGRYGNNAFNGLNNIAYDAKNQEVVCLAAGKQSFMRFGLDGIYKSSASNGIYGDDLIVGSNQQYPYLVYNEYNPSEISGNYNLLFYNEKGDLLERAAPYDPRKNGEGYEMSGFIQQSNNQTWFSKPFCDTVFLLKGVKPIPSYVLNFGDVKPKLDTKSEMVKQLPNLQAYLGRSFIKFDNYALFDFKMDKRLQIGMLDEKSDKIIRLRETDPNDKLYPLLQIGYIYPKGNHSFAFVIPPGSVQYLITSNQLDFKYFQDNYPELANVLSNYKDGNAPLILYFGLK